VRLSGFWFGKGHAMFFSAYDVVCQFMMLFVGKLSPFYDSVFVRSTAINGKPALQSVCPVVIGRSGSAFCRVAKTYMKFPIV
jgi:hypothetical protein